MKGRRFPHEVGWPCGGRLQRRWSLERLTLSCCSSAVNNMIMYQTFTSSSERCHFSDSSELWKTIFLHKRPASWREFCCTASGRRSEILPPPCFTSVDRPQRTHCVTGACIFYLIVLLGHNRASPDQLVCPKCAVFGGHTRQLLRVLFQCRLPLLTYALAGYEYLQMEDKPFDRDPSSAQVRSCAQRLVAVAFCVSQT